MSQLEQHYEKSVVKVDCADWCGPFAFLKTKRGKRRENCCVKTQMKKKGEKGVGGRELVRESK